MELQYVRTIGKERQDRKKYTLSQVTDPTFTDDYGRLINRGYVVFDYDEQPHIDIITKIIKSSNYKCKMLITTKGVHFMFKTSISKIKNISKQYNWLGLKCDIKGVGLDEPNKIAYQVIKINGETRKEEFINCSSDEELDIAPNWLYHVSKKREQIDLTEDQEGQRNDLFHRLPYDKSQKKWFYI